MLTEFEDRLSVVPRWGIVRTIQKQTVDQHSFRVALIAHRLAVEVLGLRSPEYLYHVYNYAMHHDILESVTGDPPSTANPYFNKAEVEEDYKELMKHIVYSGGVHLDGHKVRDIVKLADIMEAIDFIDTEMSMGNKSVTEVRKYLMLSFSKYESVFTGVDIGAAAGRFRRMQWPKGFPVCQDFGVC